MPATTVRLFPDGARGMWPRLRWVGTVLAIMFCLGGAANAGAPAQHPPPSDDFAVAQKQTWVATLKAYAQVEPISLVRIRARMAGTLSHLNVIPGSAVAKDQVLAQVSGPRMHAFVTGREEAFRSAEARETAASQALVIVHQQFSRQLATRQDINAAKSELAAARAALKTAHAQLQEAHDMQSLRAPAAGTVMAVQAANGEQLTAGETALSLLPANRLWIHATYYGTDAARMHVGMTGRFQPADGGGAIPVRIVSVVASVAANGGRNIGLLPLASASMPSWFNGQWGTVVVDGPTRQGVTVPTSALVLDRGRWWVLVHTARGNKPQQVVPGPTKGWRTWIASGLQPGQSVVVTGAFLEYHRDIAQSYQPPD